MSNRSPGSAASPVRTPQPGETTRASRYPELLRYAPRPPGAGRVLGMLVLLLGAYFFIGVFSVTLLTGLHPASSKLTDGWTLLATNLSLAAMIPVAVLVAALAANTRVSLRTSSLHSVTGKLRWRALFVFAGIAALCEGLGLVALLILNHGSLEARQPIGPGLGNSTALILVVVLLTSPLQSAGEEYLFRGAAFQLLTWRGWWVLAAVGVSILFTLAHGVLPWQSPPLFADRLGYALVVSWLVRTIGGLEGSIAMHAMNNIVVFAYSAFAGTLAASLRETSAGWGEVGVNLVKYVLAAALITLVARRMGLASQTGSGRLDRS